MSKHEKVIAKLKEYIRNLVVRELDEASTTHQKSMGTIYYAANPMGTGIYYDTPYAFSGKEKKDKKKKKKIARKSYVWNEASK